MLELQHLQAASASDLLEWALRTYHDRFAIATSFQREGMVMIDMAAQLGGNLRVFTLDTGRLPDETWQMIDAVRTRYGIVTEVVRPDENEVQAMVGEHGPDLFYESIENRRLCCEIRKVRPLARKLAELSAWATGLRREQSETRAGVQKVDEVDGRIKLCPLADWTASEVEAYTVRHNVPVHPLYARGYTSIGCAPCTRAIRPGEDERSGRWWWEHGGPKECGIHFAADGTVRRA